MPEACNFIQKETLGQVYSCQFCEISKCTFSYRTPAMAASETPFSDTAPKMKLNINLN